jgi:O-acetyl-ADP-ribose deacetylase (regulator of RNase III)
MARIEVSQGSLTEGNETVLVNASNTNLTLGSGVSAAISRACGSSFQAHIHASLERARGGPLAPGEVLVTDAGAHPRARSVAHVAVMDYRPGSPAGAMPTPERIRAGCAALWPAIESIPADGPLSVAMVALGAGVGNLGVRTPTEIACDTLRAHLALHQASRIARVVFYGYELHEYLAVAEVVVRFFPEAAALLPAEARRILKLP